MGKLKVASLFCGCGGTDLGMLSGFKVLGKEYKKNPLDIVYANDIDSEVIKKYPEVKFYNCENLFGECDIITIHIPMSESNRNFISERFLNLMQKNSII